MDIALPKEYVIDKLWRDYLKTKEYKKGLTKAIPSHFFLVEKLEKQGLTLIYKYFVKNLEKFSTFPYLGIKTVGNWLDEWKEMHNMLFKYVLKKRGDFRTVNVRFGSPGDEDLYNIPDYRDVPRNLNELALRLHSEFLVSRNISEDEIYKILAQVHYEFIRIHPFPDGNGRIARAVTDQLSLYFGLPPAMSGYPRHSKDRRESYHKAIRSCVGDSTCYNLSQWIKGYIQIQLQRLA